ncbi:hypothetical protein ACFOLF_36965 [Paenibacillus sepulcri]|uniref:Uncharacterized protein n=1 Tax=Paenibacillus sepulcri TaxID=359917 RepID=A0ABS7BVU3_9BACL|nr:hypothetical protein [Paenibacillus sepulcri]
MGGLKDKVNGMAIIYKNEKGDSGDYDDLKGYALQSGNLTLYRNAARLAKLGITNW